MPFQNLDGGGLAGPVGAQQGEHLSLVDRQVDTVDGPIRPVVLVKAGDLDGVHGMGSPYRSASKPSRAAGSSASGQ